MATETTNTKRKSLDRKVKTSEDAPPAKKAKTTTTEAPSPKAEKVKAAAEAKKNRKRAADFIDTPEVDVEEAEPAPKKSKKQKVVAPVEEAAEEPTAAPKAKKAKGEKKAKKTEEVVDAPEPVEEKPAKAKKGKKAEKIEEAPAEVAKPIEEKPKKAKKDKKSKKAEEVVEPVEAAEEKPVKEKKAKAEKKSKKAAAEPVEVAEVAKVAPETTAGTAGASKPKKSKVDKKGKKAAEPVAEIVEDITTAETVKPKKGKTTKKEAAPVEVTEETTIVETVKPKKAKAEKATKKVVEVTEDAEVVPKSILKKGKKAAKPIEETEVVPTSISKSKKSKAEKASTANGESRELITADALEDAFDGFSSDEDDNIADQTAALLAGFDSTDESEDGGDEGIPLDMIPKVKLDKAAKKALAAAKKDADDVPGTIYVGRVPHGFYEHQMKAYFTQFGDVTRLRLARNKKSGASKHYAFVEFGSEEVAGIVARTMDNYLMFGHIMKIRLMTQEQVHKDLWKGAGKRFKVIPRAKLAARDLAQPKGRDYWKKKIESEEKARKEKMEKLKEVGYEFEMPAVRKVEDVAMKGTNEAPTVGGEVQAIAGVEAEAEKMVVDEPVKAIEPASAVVVDAVEKEVMSVISKKKAKGKGIEVIGDAVRVTKKSKKEKKVKA